MGLSQAFRTQTKKRTLPARLSITDLITITGPNNSWKQFFRYGNALPISKELPRKIIPVGNIFCADGMYVYRSVCAREFLFLVCFVKRLG